LDEPVCCQLEAVKGLANARGKNRDDCIRKHSLLVARAKRFLGSDRWSLEFSRSGPLTPTSGAKAAPTAE
jgi:hypothetical protein